MIVFIPRLPDGDTPGGLTVAKNVNLPKGEFQLDEFTWGTASGAVRLWFVANDKFTDDERELAYQIVKKNPELRGLAQNK